MATGREVGRILLDGLTGLAKRASIARSAVVVDDDEACRNVLSHLLAAYFTQVSRADSLEKGLELVASQKPDLAVVDLRLGSETGFDLITRGMKLSPGTVWICWTGYAVSIPIERLQEMGYVFILPKPLDLGVLAKVIRILRI